MNQLDARLECEKKMREFGLNDYKFKWINSKLSFGRCNTFYKVISLSYDLVGVNTPERVLLTILHEIAHALTPGEGHSFIWKKMCKEIGGNGETCYNRENTQVVEGKYKYRCSVCGHIWHRHMPMKNLGSVRHSKDNGVLELDRGYELLTIGGDK